jgi:Ricin-type beta-trefoil lectin domain-like
VLVNRNSGKALDDKGLAANDGAAVVQWARHGGNNQQWRFIDAGNGDDRLQNRTSGKVLDDANGSKTAGADLVQRSDANGSNQQFKVAESSGGYLRWLNRFSGMAVEVHGASTADGGKVVPYRDWGGANQQWQRVSAGSVDTATCTAGRHPRRTTTRRRCARPSGRAGGAVGPAARRRPATP